MKPIKITMPLYPDMQEKKSRTIEASLPDDTTQEEFWNFVLLTSTQLFGVKKEVKRGVLSNWDALGSLTEHLRERS